MALAGSQQFLNGHGLTASGGPDPLRSFNFGSDLPGDTAGRRFLVGTASFAALGVVAPDYVVPDGFLFPGGGTINFAGGADIWNYPAMPVDGQVSLGRSGATSINSPTNFAGVTGQVPPVTFPLSVSRTGSGAGTVSSNPRRNRLRSDLPGGIQFRCFRNTRRGSWFGVGFRGLERGLFRNGRVHRDDGCGPKRDCGLRNRRDI